MGLHLKELLEVKIIITKEEVDLKMYTFIIIIDQITAKSSS